VEPHKDADASAARKVDSYWADQIAAARRESGIGAASPEREPIPPAKVSRAKLAWVLGWPLLFIAAFVASAIVHDPAKEQGGLYLGGTSRGENVLVAVGLGGLVIWIVGCLILLMASLMSEAAAQRASADTARRRSEDEKSTWL
jgi:hypothetical protein